MPKNTSFFSNNLITWYLQNGRSLPWRETAEPYPIWLSEIILQQTRVAQGLPYYESFLTAFPTVFHLAKAPEEQVLKLWQGLGYYSRARNLHFTAKMIVDEYQGEFPDNYRELLNLKGVGDYTASAIASICFNEAAAVVDGNVYRVLSRVFGIATPINSTKGIKEFKGLAQQLIDETQPGTFNQAIMEFGARHCVPQSPSCSNCIFSEMCWARKQGKVKELPVKLKKTKVKEHYYNYIIPISVDGRSVLEKRTGKGIWQNLYQFPLVESQKHLGEDELIELPSYQKISEALHITSLTLYTNDVVLHKLSHKHLHTKFWIAEVEKLGDKGVLFDTIKEFPVPILLGNFISKFEVFNS